MNYTYFVSATPHRLAAHFQARLKPHRLLTLLLTGFLLLIVSYAQQALAQTKMVSHTATFNYIGYDAQPFIVPTGVTSLTVTVYGAQGGGSGAGGGGLIMGTLPVAEGQTLNLFVGGRNGINGGGSGYRDTRGVDHDGGGASDIRIGGVALANRVVVAGGGGGDGYNGGGGSGGIELGGDAGNTSQGGGYGGGTSGGRGGGGYTEADGREGVGGDGLGDTDSNGAPREFRNGGGGGGYFGGGGGANGYGGGGGSNYSKSGLVTLLDKGQGLRDGDGQITLNWVSPECSLPFTVVPSSQTILLGQSATLTASGATTYTWSNGQTEASITVSPTSTTALSVTGVTGTCSVTASALITVNTPTTVCITNTCPELNGTYVETIQPDNSSVAKATRYFANSATHTVLAFFPVQGGWFLIKDGPVIVYYSNPSNNRTIPTTGWSASTTCTGTLTITEGTCSACSSPTVSIAATPSLTITNSQSITLTASGATSYAWSTSATTVSISPTLGGIYSVTGTTGACSATASVTVTAADLSPALSLPQANFAVGATNNFLVSLFEVNGLPTTLGNVTITVTAPVGYTLSFNNTLTSIEVTGSTTNPAAVTNANWTVLNTLEDRQMTLMIKPGQSIAARATVNLGFSISRTSANSGSTASITVNITNDATRGYDGNSGNNVYARIINGL